jgi:hypothetical protein
MSSVTLDNERAATAIVALLLSLLAVSTTATPAAAETWTILPFNARGVDPDTGAAFRALLESEVAQRSSAEMLRTEASCGDAVCARAAAESVGADVAVYGAITALGTKIIVTATAVSRSAGPPVGQGRITVDAVEDLEQASVRIARALTEQEAVEDTAELGAITANEARPDTRREGHRGLSLRVGGVVPVAGSLPGAGIMVDVGYWFETRWFALEPYIGFRTRTSDDGESWGQLPIGVGAYYVASLGNIAPFIGGGGGLRWFYGNRLQQDTVTTFVALEREREVEDDVWGFGANARAGLILARTYAVQAQLFVEYDISFVEREGASNPQAIQAGVGVVF